MYNLLTTNICWCAHVVCFSPTQFPHSSEIKVGLTLKKYKTLRFYNASTERNNIFLPLKSVICPDKNTYIIKHALNPHNASTSRLFSALFLEEMVLFWESWPEYPKGNTPVTSLHMSKSSIKALNVQEVYWRIQYCHTVERHQHDSTAFPWNWYYHWVL